MLQLAVLNQLAPGLAEPMGELLSARGTVLRRAVSKGSVASRCRASSATKPAAKRRDVDLSGVGAMTPAQELANAGTMLPTAVFALLTLLSLEATLTMQLAAAGVLLHFPFSFGYHVSCAIWHGQVHPTDNNLGLKLDLGFIHVTGAILALATSGSLSWFLVLAVFNGTCFFRTFQWSNSALERRLCRLVCGLGYMLPIGQFDTVLLLKTMGAFFVMAVPFLMNRQFRGWGHATSHLFLVPVANYVFVAAAATSVSF